MKKLLSICIVSLFAFSCSKVPVTDRPQLILISNSEMKTLSLQSYNEFLETAVISKNTESTASLNKVGNSITQAVEKYLTENNNADDIKNFSWSYTLVESTDVNAFCMPGGQIVFYTGILPYTQDEIGMAVVMGHEVAHAVAKHSAEQITQQLLLTYGGSFVDLLVSQKSEAIRGAINTVYGLGTQVGVSLPFSRKHETEADRLGLIFMAMAGYDPNEAIAFWERMSANSAKVPEFLSTHPADETRIKNIKDNLSEALKYYNVK